MLQALPIKNETLCLLAAVFHATSKRKSREMLFFKIVGLALGQLPSINKVLLQTPIMQVRLPAVPHIT